MPIIYRIRDNLPVNVDSLDLIDWSVYSLGPATGSLGGSAMPFSPSDDFYGFEGGSGVVPPVPFPGSPSMSPAVPAVVVTLAALVAKWGSVMGNTIWTFLRGLGVAMGSRISSVNLPGWVKTALGFLGFKEGMDIVLSVTEGQFPDLIPGDGFPSLPGFGGDAPHIEIPGATAHVVGSWSANGVTFYRLADGRLAVQNKKGRWRVWRPKKPIVIMPTGMANLRDLIRADAVVDKQVKALSKMINRRKPKPAPKAKALPAPVVVHADSHH